MTPLVRMMTHLAPFLQLFPQTGDYVPLLTNRQFGYRL